MKNDLVTNEKEDAAVILIVDDEPNITTIYTLLFQHYGFKVSSASDGKNALKLIDDVSPNIILSDYMMPLMDGAELCTILKNDPRWKDVPFILQSAAFHKKSINAPYDLLLQKPIVFTTLLEEVMRLLEKK
jgi:CheY-like chemotaxis protein